MLDSGGSEARSSGLRGQILDTFVESEGLRGQILDTFVDSGGSEARSSRHSSNLGRPGAEGIGVTYGLISVLDPPLGTKYLYLDHKILRP